MDLLTQGLLGSAVAQSGSRDQETRIATLIGFFSGLLADADVFIRSDVDPLLTIEYHRHFTHSIFFIPIGALIACLVFYPFLRNKHSFGRIYYYCLLGYLFSGTLDLCTSYGTYWLWPLIDERLALHIIGIVDLIFTPMLLLVVVACYIKKQPVIAKTGLLCCTLYLFIGFLQLQRATDVAYDLAVSRGHEPARLLVKPSPLTLLLWRSVYEHGDNYYVDAIHVSWKSKIYQGNSIKKYESTQIFSELPEDSVLTHDIRRFTRFSDGYIASIAGNDSIIGDIRYALLPNSIKPLWGIRFDKRTPEEHVQYHFFRRSNREDRQSFMKMILGKDINT